jgi:hypothetical protein
MKRLTICLLALVACASLATAQTGEWGDAPEGVLAYPHLGVMGQFPTCFGVAIAPYIYHGPLCWAHFPGLAPPFDFEIDGNAGLCPFPPGVYDQDECFGVDAGLMFPDPYTIDQNNNIVLCPGAQHSTLGPTCGTVQWGVDIDIMVTNNMPVQGYFNLIIDYDMSGFWGGSVTCPSGQVPEHVVVNYFPVPINYYGPISGLTLPPVPGFTLGPNQGWVWARFTISEQPVPTPWLGEGSFEDGETEDYLLYVGTLPSPVEDKSWGTIKGLYR